MHKGIVCGIAAGGLAFGLGTTAAQGQTSYVGKKASVASSSPAFVAVPVLPATLTALSVGVPAKYKSKKHMLLISTSMQVECVLDGAYATVKVGGFNAEPDPSNAYLTQCSNNGGGEARAMEWFLLPESAGGPVIPPGATVDLIVTSNTGASAVSNVSMKVELQK